MNAAIIKIKVMICFWILLKLLAFTSSLSHINFDIGQTLIFAAEKFEGSLIYQFVKPKKKNIRKG